MFFADESIFKGPQELCLNLLKATASVEGVSLSGQALQDVNSTRIFPSVRKRII